MKVHRSVSWASPCMVNPWSTQLDCSLVKGCMRRASRAALAGKLFFALSWLHHVSDAPLSNPFHSAGSLTSKGTTARDILGSLGRRYPPQCAAAEAVLPASMPGHGARRTGGKEGGACQGMNTDTCTGEHYSTRQEVRRPALLPSP